MIRYIYNSLDDYVAQEEDFPQVRKKDIRPGDWLLLKTCNSAYTIRLLGDNQCIVSGGWFDRKGVSPFETNIVGCTWGGSAIKTDTIAACGLCLEFSNKVTTTPILAVVLMRYWIAN